MKRFLLAAAILAATAGIGASPAAATNECRGLQVCVRVAGPWVVVPAASTTPRPRVDFQLSCPRGYVIGGLDAELSDRAIDVWFLGAAGSPVAPGRTTSKTIVFVARYVGSGGRAPTFRPHAGCIPGGGGGRRTPTAFFAVFPPGKPTVRRVRTVRVRATGTAAVRCHNDERLVAAYSARGFRTAKPPSPQLVASFSARTRLTANGISAQTSDGNGRAVVQLAAVCAGGR